MVNYTFYYGTINKNSEYEFRINKDDFNDKNVGNV